MNKIELQKRVDARKSEIAQDSVKFNEFREKVTDFIEGVKKKSTIYALIKNLSIWKDLEKLIGGD